MKTHKCTIVNDSTSCLPKLPPYANRFERLIREWKKNLLVSELYMKTKYHFRSTAAIFSERRRQVSHPFYVIHPFSNFMIYREVISCICWFLLFLIGPYAAMFGYKQQVTGTMNLILIFTKEFVLWLLFGNMLLNFLIGYHNPQTKEIILNPKQIAYNYLKTYFIFDFLAYAPFTSYLEQKQKLTAGIYITRGIRYFFMLPRIHTMLEYFRHITAFLRIGDALHGIVCRILLSLFILHWSSCMLYFVFEIYDMFDNAHESWIRTSGLYLDKYYPSEKYARCLYVALTNFYRTGANHVESKSDYFTLSILVFTGVVLHAYIIAVVLHSMGAASAPENKYEELLQQLHEYLCSKNMPLHMITRLRAYFEHRFQKRFFQERAILGTLSEHLLHEIKLHSCQHLIDKVSLFDGLSKRIIGSIIGELELEVYLTNDVIVQHGVSTEYVHIISYGTVAVIHISGIEIGHLHDCDIFCVFNLFHYDTVVNIVAVEICEVYRMLISKFQKYMTIPSVASKLRNLFKIRKQVVKDYLSRYESEQRDRQEILHKVGEGQILEKGHMRGYTLNVLQ